MAAARFLIVFALSLLLFSQETKAQGNGAVLLYNNGNNPLNTRGIVLVYCGGQWGTICAGGSDSIPDVVCHQLGYTGGSFDDSDFGTTLYQPVIQNVYCSSDYLVILQCDYISVGTLCDGADSSYSQALVQIACYSSRIWDSPYTGMVRLRDGFYSAQGIVQVYCGRWGAICYDRPFNTDAADTICTQLGYTSASAINSVSYYNGRVLYSYEDLYCNAVEDCLRYCVSCPASDAMCSTNEVVSVTCTHDGTAYRGSYRYTCRSTIFDGLSPGVIAGIVIGVLFFVIICLAVTIGIPVCICCCLGIGIGAAAGSTRRTNVYSTITE